MHSPRRDQRRDFDSPSGRPRATILLQGAYELNAIGQVGN